jgi:hypothetical protein
MNKFTKILTAGTLALASISASASQITVGGVTWDPDYQTSSANDFISTAEFTQWFSTDGLSVAGAPGWGSESTGTVGAEVQGVGGINRFNGSTGFVCATCELTFAFGGVKFDGDMSGDGSLFDIAYSQTNGYFNIYFDNTADFDAGQINNQADADNAVDGSLFLSLGLQTLQQGAGYTPQTGSLFSFWHATGGAALDNFDTDTQFFGTDLSFIASVDFQDANMYGSGTGVASGNTISVSVPEPTSLAIFGLALLGLAGASRRKA